MTSIAATASHPFVVVIQDEGSFTHVEYVREASAVGAQAAVEDLVDAMEGTAAGACDTTLAAANLDIDGDVVFAVWYTLPGSDLRSLVAIVHDTNA
jgi:hypothetical protein